MRPIDADSLMEKLNGIWDCNDMTFEPVDGCCIDADCKSCRWRETIEYVKRLVKNQTTVSPWHRVEEPPDGNEDAVIYYEWTGISGRVYRETSIISLNELIVLGRRPIAWTEKPEPQKEENKEGFVALAIKETERSEE